MTINDILNTDPIYYGEIKSDSIFVSVSASTLFNITSPYINIVGGDRNTILKDTFDKVMHSTKMIFRSNSDYDYSTLYGYNKHFDEYDKEELFNYSVAILKINKTIYGKSKPKYSGKLVSLV